MRNAAQCMSRYQLRSGRIRLDNDGARLSTLKTELATQEATTMAQAYCFEFALTGTGLTVVSGQVSRF